MPNECRLSPWLVLMVVLQMTALQVPADADETPHLSEQGFYSLSFESALDPIAINRIHSWLLHIDTVDGQPLENAEIIVDGGMPAHAHGLPTQPRVVANLGEGNYRLEGMRFHMPGSWEITITIEANGTTDRVVIALEL